MKQTSKPSLILTLDDKSSLLLIPNRKKNDFSNVWIFSSLRLPSPVLSRQNLFVTLLRQLMHDCLQNQTEASVSGPEQDAMLKTRFQ